MDQIRQICAEIQTVANNRLTRYSEVSRSSANQVGLICMLGSVALFSLLLFSNPAQYQTVGCTAS